MTQALDSSHRRPPRPLLPADPGLRKRRALTMAMAALGVLILGILPPTSETGSEGRIWAEFGIIRWALLGLIAALAFVPAVHRAVFPLLERLREPSPTARRRIAVGAAIVAGLYFIWTAHWQDRDFFPKSHDEQSYLLQMRMLAEGNLWMAPHPLADHFETFHVLVEPVYASVYFPGTALMYFPGVLLEGIGWPVWLLPVIASAACVGLLYTIATRLVDGLAGLLAALVLASLSWFRVTSILLMGQIPALLLGLLMVWAWLCWRERLVTSSDEGTPEKGPAAPAWRGMLADWAWMGAIGAFAGWMAITRPVDALSYALPVGVGILIDLYRRRAPVVARIASLAIIVAAAAPFLAIQIIFNKNVSGSYSTPPFEYYIDKFQPQTSFGFHDFDPDVRPEGTLPQKHALYDLFVVPRAKNHTLGQLPLTWARKYFRFTIDVTLPGRPLLILAPLGLLALGTLPRRVLFATMPLFMALYALYTFYLEHYIIVIAPAAILLLVLSMRALERAWPARRPVIATAVTGSIAFVCIANLPELNRTIRDETFPSAMLRLLRNNFPYTIQGKAVVLVRWTPGRTFSRNYHQEPVYNTEAPWPDDNRIIFAHDLAGSAPVYSPQWWRANQRIFEYYAQKQPDRQFILFDRGQVDSAAGVPFAELGRAPELAEQARRAAE
jgi:4-amino-4-deoxy-L-arabinose transferase-like glycosyltransferase